GSVVPGPPVVSGHDTWMVQAGGGPCLAMEELQLGVAQATASLEELERHRAREYAVACLEDPSEATSADLADHLEATGDDPPWEELVRRCDELLRRRNVLLDSSRRTLAKGRLLRLLQATRSRVEMLGHLRPPDCDRAVPCEDRPLQLEGAN